MPKSDPWVPLRKSYPNSQKVNAVSIGAEMLFTRLLAQCDDHAHYWASPGVILGKLLTHRMVEGEVCLEDVQRWLSELCDKELVSTYEVRGIAYLEVLNCKKQLRKDIRLSVKYPDPPKSLQKRARTESVTVAHENGVSSASVSASVDSSASVSAGPDTEPSEPEDAGYLDRPVGSRGEVAQAHRHIADCFHDAFQRDSNLPVVPKCREWVESMMGQFKGGALGLVYVQSFTTEDFTAAYNAYMGRKNKAQTWTSTWVLNARNSRVATDQEQQLAATKRQETTEAAECHVADDLAAKKDANARDTAWEKLPVPEKHKFMQAEKAKHLFLTGRALEASAMRAWWVLQEIPE